MDPGRHVEFQISTKNTYLVEGHPMNIRTLWGKCLKMFFSETSKPISSKHGMNGL
jgi:hypothetical protein